MRSSRSWRRAAARASIWSRSPDAGASTSRTTPICRYSPRMIRLLLVTALVGCGASKPEVTVAAPPPAPATTVETPVTAAPTRPWPTTRKLELVETVQGKAIADPFRWLEDEHAPEVQTWMAAQDAYTRGELAKLPLRGELETRIKELFYFDSITAPVHRGGRYFYSRKHANKEKSIVYWKQGEQGAEKVLFDPNQWSEDGSKGLHGWYPSHD